MSVHHVEFPSGYRDQIWSLKDLAGPEVVVSDSEEFPGPASDAPLEKVKKYVQTKADGYEGGSGDEGRRLLWSIAGLALRFKVRRTISRLRLMSVLGRLMSVVFNFRRDECSCRTCVWCGCPKRLSEAGEIVIEVVSALFIAAEPLCSRMGEREALRVCDECLPRPKARHHV